MLIPVLLFIVGLLCLIKGGDWFVDGATVYYFKYFIVENSNEPVDRKSTRLNSSHKHRSRMPSSA